MEMESGAILAGEVGVVEWLVVNQLILQPLDGLAWRGREGSEEIPKSRVEQFTVFDGSHRIPNAL